MADENLSRRFVNALRRHNATINIVRVQEVGLLGMDDAAILDWAVDNNYVLITKDRATISPLVAQRLVKDIPSPRIFIIRPGSQLNAVLAMIEAVIAHDPDTDWQYPVRWIP